MELDYYELCKMEARKWEQIDDEEAENMFFSCYVKDQQ